MTLLFILPAESLVDLPYLMIPFVSHSTRCDEAQWNNYAMEAIDMQDRNEMALPLQSDCSFMP